MRLDELVKFDQVIIISKIESKCNARVIIVKEATQIAVDAFK